MSRTVPVMASESPGNFLTGALWNANVKALGDYVTGKPLFIAYQASAQSLTSGSFFSATLDTELLDVDGGHSTVTNTSRYIFQVAGRYRVTGSVCFASSSAGFRGAKFLMNGGTAVIGSEQLVTPVTGFQTTCATSATVTVSVNDYIELQAFQNSGGSLSTSSNASFEYVTCLQIEWIST